LGFRVRVMVLNATFNYITVISWQSVLLKEETRVPGENHRPHLALNNKHSLPIKQVPEYR